MSVTTKLSAETRRVLGLLHGLFPSVPLSAVVMNDELCAMLWINVWCVNEGADGMEPVDVIGQLLAEGA
jgi:hypothetical protein